MPPRTSLGACVFGFPAAPAFAVPQEHVPDAWLLSFLEEYTDSSVWWGIFRSCRAGRDYVLQRAKKAALTLTARHSQPFDKWRQQLTSVQLALSMRGLLPSSLTVSCAGGDARAQLVPSALMGAGAGITHLSYKPTPPGDPAARAALLTDTVAALTGLQSLQLWSPCSLPPLALLPNLTALTTIFTPTDTPDHPDHVPYEKLGPSIGALARQLQSLTINTHKGHCIQSSHLLRWVFPGRRQNHTLTRLSCDTILFDDDIDILLSRAPGLRELRVYSLMLWEDYSTKKWRVQRLDVQREPSMFPLANFPWIQLSRLPKSTCQGRVKVAMCPAYSQYALEICIGLPHGLHAYILRRFRDYEFTHGRVYIDACETINPDHMVSGLRSILRAMADYQGVEGQVVDLTHTWGWGDTWPWARELPDKLCAVAAECVPLLTHLKIGVCFKTLDDNHLSAALQMGPHLHRVSAQQLCLQSDQHADKEWLWPVLALTGKQTTDMTSLLKLPKPSTYKGEGKPVLATGGTWNVHATEADAERLTDWLPHVQWSGEPTFTLPHPTRNLPLLSTQLSVLRAVRLSDTDIDTQQGVTVQLSKWPLPVNTLGLLQGLPAWCGALDLCTCTWPLKPTQYTQLASHVPTTYTRWLLGARLSDARINAICDGVNQRRAGLGLQPLRLVVPGHEGRDRRVGEHVIVSSRAEGGSDGADSSGGGSDESEGYSSDSSDMMGEGEVVPIVGDEEWSE